MIHKLKVPTLLVFVFSLIVLFSQCDKQKQGCSDSSACNYDSSAEINDGSCINKGKVIFWKRTECNVTITINGISKSLTGFRFGPPRCDNDYIGGRITFLFCPGTYDWSATSIQCPQNPQSGTISIYSKGCFTIKVE